MSGGVRTSVKGFLINANSNWRSTGIEAADEKQKPQDVSEPLRQTDIETAGHHAEENHNERQIPSNLTRGNSCIAEEPDDDDDDDPLPSVKDLQLQGDPLVGQEITVCGHCINGTSLCDADQWLRHHQDGSVSNIDGATSPEHLVTADDIGACLAVEVVPLDVRNRKGKLQKLFANDHKNISCDPKMQSLVDKIFHMGHGSCRVFLSGYMGVWEPGTL
uniref:uncharacterized protein LOC101314038 n=1 Tax=Fragaria vesca subsp. vesca TaxID=101020 RepID=UPI0005C7FAAA|nr:PREDICTED: uncharacterized protein LOC101314038 [Fragaria vesca subsp. vesca]